MKKIRIASIVLLTFVLQLVAQPQFGVAEPNKKSLLPLSRECTFMESFSPAEVTLMATGLGKNNDLAEIDAQKSAVFFVLAGGTNPLITTSEEKQKFAAIQEEFFKYENIKNYITYVARKVKTYRKMKIEGKTLKKMVKIVRVNKKKLEEDLISRGVLESATEVAETIGNPVIMVIPESGTGENPLDILKNNMEAKTAATVIQSYLSARQFETKVPEAAAVLDDLTALQTELSGMDEDITAQIARIIGADIYFTYSDIINSESFGTSKASVTVKAYETTTARLLGAETGYSPAMQVKSPEALLDVAVGNAVEKVLSRVMAWWKQDTQKGIQYKVVFKLPADLNDDESEEISDVVLRTIEKQFIKYKENLVTSQTLDYVIWAVPEEISGASSLYRMLRNGIEGIRPDLNVNRISINRKLIIMKVTVN